MIKNVKFIDADARLIDALQEMKRLNRGVLLVWEDQKMSGVLTIGNIVNHARREGFYPEQKKVKEVVNRKLCYCHEDMNLESALSQMKKLGIGYLIVLKYNKKLAGILPYNKHVFEFADQT
jgi:predicted transcriptional regulator